MEFVNWMKEHPCKGIIVEGHTDSVGGREFNLNLSLRRAQSVKNFLVNQGARASLISIDGYGYSRPVDSNSTPEGRQRNRRVEVRQW
jgi:OOP family OmpA-OmpF porin